MLVGDSSSTAELRGTRFEGMVRRGRRDIVFEIIRV